MKKSDNQKFNRLNYYRIMWVFVFFDLPTETQADRKNYANFRKSLINDGFTMLQYSVYTRHCSSLERAQVHEKRIKRHLPPDGNVIVFTLTDKQYSMMKNFQGTRARQMEQYGGPLFEF